MYLARKQLDSVTRVNEASPAFNEEVCRFHCDCDAKSAIAIGRFGGKSIRVPVPHIMHSPFCLWMSEATVTEACTSRASNEPEASANFYA